MFYKTTGDWRITWSEDLEEEITKHEWEDIRVKAQVQMVNTRFNIIKIGRLKYKWVNQVNQ